MAFDDVLPFELFVPYGHNEYTMQSPTSRATASGATTSGATTSGTFQIFGIYSHIAELGAFQILARNYPQMFAELVVK